MHAPNLLKDKKELFLERTLSGERFTGSDLDTHQKYRNECDTYKRITNKQAYECMLEKKPKYMKEKLFAGLFDKKTDAICRDILDGCPDKQISSKYKISIYAILYLKSELDRLYKAYKTFSGIEIGNPGGRKFVWTTNELYEAVDFLKSSNRDMSIEDFCKKMKITRNTLYRIVSPDGDIRPDGMKIIQQGVK
jgi:hypothetical protein